MTDARTSKQLRTDCDQLLADVPEWNDPANAEARTAFKFAMRGRQYGREPCHSAWLWFLTGWNDNE